MFRTRIITTILLILSVVATGSLTVAGSNEQSGSESISRSAAQSEVASAIGPSSSNVRSKGSVSRNFSLNIERRGHTATALDDGRVLIVGGENNKGSIASAEVIEPDSQQSRMLSSMKVARSGHTATPLLDGTILIIGGSNKSRALNSTEIFDPDTESFSAGPRLNRARSGHSATLLADGRVLIAGGRKDKTAEILDLNGRQFTLLSSLTLDQRLYHGSTLLNNGNVLLAGGLDPNGDRLDTAELFNSSTSTFEEVVGWMSVQRVRPILNQLPDGKVQIIGGDAWGTMEMYDPVARIFRSAAPLPLTSDLLPSSALLMADTRNAYLDSVHAASTNKVKPNNALKSRTASETPDKLSGFSITEIPGSSIAVIAGGADDQGQSVKSVLVIPSTKQAVVSTDRIEYAYGKTALINGSGWRPGEKILIVRQQVVGEKNRLLIHAVADAKGNFANADLTPADHQPSGYILTAMGEESGYIAQTTYRSAPPLTEKFARLKKPTKIKFKMPVNGKAGSVDTELGPLTWKPRKEKSSLSTQAFGGNASLDGCMELGPVSFCGENRLEILESHFNVNVELDGDITVGISEDLIPFFEARLVLDQSVSLGITYRLSLEGSINAEAIVLPFFPPIGFTLAEIIEGEIKAGLLMGVDISFETTTVEYSFNASESAKIGASLSTSSGFQGIKEFRQADVSGGTSVIEVGKGCLKLYGGPDIELSAGALGVEASVDARVTGFIEGCIDPEISTTCLRFDENIDGGFEAELGGSASLGPLSVGDSFSVELLRETLVDGTQVVTDTEPPLITADNITISTAADQCSQKATYTPEASDSCSGIANVICLPPSGAVFSKGVTSVTCTATDNKGNGRSTSFSVEVLDNQSPKFTAAPPNLNRTTDPGNCSAIVTYPAPNISDNCPGASVVCTPQSGSTFEKGITTVNCTATDASQNTAAASFSVTVTDNERPTLISAPDVSVIAAPGTFATTVNYSPQLSDNCPGLDVVLSPPSGSALPVGTTTVAGRATDAAGNITEFKFKVIVYNIVVIDEATGSVFRAIWNGGPTAQYEFFDCSKGQRLSRTMKVTQQSCKIEGRDTGADPKRPDRNVSILFNPCTLDGSVLIQIGAAKYNFNDLDVRNSRLTCP
jgi:hypothetical protein